MLAFKEGGNKTGNLLQKTSFQKRKEIQILDLSEKSLAFSRFAKPGQISVFILGAPWCHPCHALKNALQEGYDNGSINTKDVDIYYCNLAKNVEDTPDVLDSREGYRNIKYVDQLTEFFPTTYILTPTTNCYAIVKGYKGNEILKMIQDLQETKKEYFSLSALNSQLSPSPSASTSSNCGELQKKIQNLEAEKKALEEQNESLRKYLEMGGGKEEENKSLLPEKQHKESYFECIRTGYQADICENGRFYKAYRITFVIRPSFRSQMNNILDGATVSVSPDGKRIEILNQLYFGETENLKLVNSPKLQEKVISQANGKITMEFPNIEILNNPKILPAKEGIYMDIVYRE